MVFAILPAQCPFRMRQCPLFIAQFDQPESIHNDEIGIVCLRRMDTAQAWGPHVQDEYTLIIWWFDLSNGVNHSSWMRVFLDCAVHNVMHDTRIHYHCAFVRRCEFTRSNNNISSLTIAMRMCTMRTPPCPCSMFMNHKSWLHDKWLTKRSPFMTHYNFRWQLRRCANHHWYLQRSYIQI